ncbi:hypothetical protein FS837_001062 [Tulasnella sp. UAMH 9824]|nr:hypothetical protein FS837_001062 [Tulasnella sp. UAMH 9824]
MCIACLPVGGRSVENDRPASQTHLDSVAKSTLAFTAAAAFFDLGVKAVPAGSQSCYTVHSDHFAVHPNTQTSVLNKRVTLNSNSQVVYGDPGTPIQVEFQSCPTLLGNSPDEDIYVEYESIDSVDILGRILVGSDCLKIGNPDSATEPYFASVAACSSDTTPTPAEKWSYGTSDDRGVVWWSEPYSSDSNTHRRAQDGSDRIGYIPADNTGTPAVSAGTHLLDIGCHHECTNFSIVTQLN